MIARLRRWNAALDEAIDARALALARMAVAPLVVLHLQPSFAEAAANRFNLPYASWYPIASPGLHRAILWATVAAAVATSLGLCTRLAAWATALGVGYNLFLSQTYFHHNRAFLLILLVGVAVLPTGARLSLDRRLGTPTAISIGGGRRLALTVLRVEVALVYLASGTSKLLDPDWWGGTVTLIRVERYASDLISRGVPQGVVDLLTSPGFHQWAAKAVVLTELFIGAGLLWRRSRLGAVWTAVAFHTAIQLTADVQVFSVAAICALVIWVTPQSRDRILRLGSDARAATVALIHALDWTGRFTVGRHAKPGWEVVDRDGSVLRAARARWFVLSRLPITFLFTAPALLRPIRRAYAEGVGARDSGAEVPE